MFSIPVEGEFCAALLPRAVVVGDGTPPPVLLEVADAVVAPVVATIPSGPAVLGGAEKSSLLGGCIVADDEVEEEVLELPTACCG